MMSNYHLKRQRQQQQQILRISSSVNGASAKNNSTTRTTGSFMIPLIAILTMTFAVTSTNAFSATSSLPVSLSSRRTMNYHGHRSSTMTWMNQSSPNNNNNSNSNNDRMDPQQEQKRKEEMKFQLDVFLSDNNLRAASEQIKKYHRSFANNNNNNNNDNDNNRDDFMEKSRLVNVFRAIEERTSEADENDIRNSNLDKEDTTSYPPISPARMEMTDMYRTLQSMGHLRVFGAVADTNNYLPAKGSKFVTPTTLKAVTGMSMVSLTPQPSNTFFLAGTALALTEAAVSLATGMDLNLLVGVTILLATLDKLIVNGAVFESVSRTLKPEYGRKILRHEAGHFLCAYLLGCPVEGCVLSAWAALRDSRFEGTVSAGTSFFDPALSEQMNGVSGASLTRASIDRYSIIVMGGIAAEAIHFGRADGGAGDEMALVRFLSALNPRTGGAVTWDSEMIRNQARWGAMQAVLLLQQYSLCYDALVHTLEQNKGSSSLGECIYAIEHAAQQNHLPLPQPSLGTIIDQGPNGQWVPTTTTATTTTTTTQNDNTAEIQESLLPEDNELLVSSSEEFLAKYRQIMDQKLQDIDARLNELDNQ